MTTNAGTTNVHLADDQAIHDPLVAPWLRALDRRDPAGVAHARRVAALALALGRRLGFRPTALEHLRRGALLHDVGKLAIPDAILLKPGPLSEAEWAIVREHPVHGCELLSGIPALWPVLGVVASHHERWDGTGYPRALKEKEIPLWARIVALADAWEALTADRPYRPAYSPDQALRIVREQRGRAFDPRLVPLFLEVLEQAEAERPAPAGSPA